MLKLREYQQSCHDAILREWGYTPWWDGERPTSRKTVAILATSAGKTLIAAHLAKTLVAKGKRVLFCADREELILQPVEKFYKATGLMAAVHRGTDSAPAHANVVVGSVQTLARRLPAGRAFDVLIDDECHRNTELRAKIHTAYPEAQILGITATAFRRNMADLSKWYDTVAFELGTFDLIQEGYITPVEVLTAPLQVDLSSVKQVNGDFDQDQVSSVLEPHYRAVAATIKKYAAKRRILAFLPLIQSSKDFVSVLQQEGIAARHCDGQSKDRKEIIHQFEEGQFQVLSNSSVFSTGVDFIRCDALLNLAPTRSRGEYRQRAGRIMRLLPGVIDPGGVTLPTAEERRAAIAASSKPTSMILDVLWQTRKIGLAGPASIIATTQEEEDELGKRIRKQRSAEQLEAISRAFQHDKEEQLRKELEKLATQGAELRDAREIILELGDHFILNYEPVTESDSARVNEWQEERLERYGYKPDSLKYSGQAKLLIDSIEQRQNAGMAPIQAFKALREAGADPIKTTLNDAIRKLGGSFPCTFGAKYQGTPLKDVPLGYWEWLVHGKGARGAWPAVKRKHPAVYRYVTKIVFSEKKHEMSLL